MKISRLCFFATMLLLQGCPVSPFDRTDLFRAQAKAGMPLVQAIEAFRKDTGAYPATLAELVPKYLPEIPKGPAYPKRKFGEFNGWNYFTMTNAGTVSYNLDYFMGKGGVRYDAPNWIGDEDGHDQVLSLNP